MDVSLLEWSFQESQLYDVIKNSCFPVIIKVTRGYYDMVKRKDLGIDEIIFLKSKGKEDRILTRDIEGRCYFSFPKTDSNRFISDRHKRPRQLAELVNTTKMPFKVYPVDKTFTTKCFHGGTLIIETMIVIKEYEDYFAIGNAIINGRMCSSISVIPGFMKAYVKVAIGLKGHGNEKLQKCLDALMKISKESLFDEAFSNQEIKMFQTIKEEDSRRLEDDDWSTIEPTGTGSLLTNMSDKNYQSLGPYARADNLYEELSNDHFANYDTSRQGDTQTKGRTEIESTASSEHADYEKNEYHYPIFSSEDQYYEINTKAQSQSKETIKFHTINEVPADISEFSRQDISQCLELLALGEFVPHFRRDCVDGQLIQRMTKEMFVKDYNFSESQATRLHMFVKEHWRPK